MTKRDILKYEVHASWWAPLISNNFLQRLAGKYFAWKVNRKWDAYNKSLKVSAEVRQFNRAVGAYLPLTSGLYDA
ncbi:hypothetical protein K3G63_10995 [Hymenobacter sp. HSC-4F20]|uniref:hypothetical protein n=1 Tax=Hymenobacter sp. HSC-4F20 TaxID=2864135 RepID=UPI001C736467|nr:hypothetical protein [Hymenobacter sp. HSC-4F20]MBX0290969.1 hypothetical protein [Hymenobacter sp. HSC-4F20]